MTIQPNVAFRLYREYLGVSQAELGRDLGVTSTSVSRWETGTVELTSFSAPFLHIRAVVEKKLQREMNGCFTKIKPDLKLGEFAGLFGIPSAEIRSSRDGTVYIGTAQIYEHHDHTIHFSLSQGKWVALDRDGKAHDLTPSFLATLRHQTRATKRSRNQDSVTTRQPN